jgi:hypothetical protein
MDDIEYDTDDETPDEIEQALLDLDPDDELDLAPDVDATPVDPEVEGTEGLDE